jgi:hypothetical protein
MRLALGRYVRWQLTKGQPHKSVANSSFDDFSEALEDTTIHIPQVLKWSDSLTLCSFDKGSDHL